MDSTPDPPTKPRSQAASLSFAHQGPGLSGATLQGVGDATLFRLLVELPRLDMLTGCIRSLPIRCRMIRRNAVLLACSLLGAGVAAPQDKPPLPYIDQGACPFECCTYREWRANEAVYEKDAKVPKPEPMLKLKPGELLYTLHYTGEGFDLFWYKGKLYTDQIAADKPDPDPPPPDLDLQILSRPLDNWWIKIKTKDGKVGWMKDPPYFENSDACA